MQETRSGLSNNPESNAKQTSDLKGLMPPERPTAKSMWRLLLFFVFYMIFRLLVETAISVGFLAFGPSFPEPFFSFFMMPSDIPDVEYSLSGNGTAIVSAIGFIVAGLMIRAKAFEYDSKFTPKKESPVSFYALTALASVGLAIFLNILIAKSGIIEISEDYAEVAASQYSCSFAVGLIVYGFISPLSEELMFRGILYNGFKRYFMKPAALLLCAAFFALYHGNGVQGMYSFVMSVFIIYAYEKSGDFKICILIHMVCNLAAYILTYGYPYLSADLVWMLFAASFALAGTCIIFMFFRDRIPGLKKASDE